MDISWDPTTRIAAVAFPPETHLGGDDGALLVEALRGWIGAEGKAFALLADTEGVRTADAQYRATAHAFFKLHRDTAYIAVTNLGPVIRIIAEMFRIGSGVRLKAFAKETSARFWLKQQGLG